MPWWLSIAISLYVGLPAMHVIIAWYKKRRANTQDVVYGMRCTDA
jgi:hypothetical protein